MNQANLKVKSGELEVLFSGTVIAYEKEPIIFEFPNTHSSLKILCHFLNDTSKKPNETKINVIDEKTMEIFFINFSNSLGTGNTEVWDIGFLDDRVLYFNYRVYAIKGISNTFHYTFYLGKEGSYASK